MKFGSVFAGIGGFDLGLESAGWECAWQIENDKFCNKVLAKRWPSVPRYGDVTQVKGSELEPVDLLMGGVPCQDVSIAGKRAGLVGARTGLFWEFLRLAKDMRPEFVLFENVAGLLSSKNGADWHTILDVFQELGYVVEANVLDSRFFGVPQRRRRVFLICRDVGRGRRASWRYSLPMLTQALIEISLLVLVARSSQFSIERAPWASARTHFVDGLRRRMRLFDAETELGWLRLLRDWEDARARSASELNNWVSRSDESAFAERSTAESLRWSWADLYAEARLFIISMDSTTTTDPRTSSSLTVLRNISASIAPLKALSPDCWDEVSSGSIAEGVCTNFARATTSDFPGGLGRLPLWKSFARHPESSVHALLGPRIRSAGKVQPQPEGGSGDPPSGRETGESVAGTLGGGAPGARGWRGDLDSSGADIPVVGRALTEDAGSLRANAPGTQPTGSSVRRLTPTECERLQGFPDGWTCLEATEQLYETEGYLSAAFFFGDGPRYSTTVCKCPDGPRYAALGNAVTTNVVRWIGERLLAAEKDAALEGLAA